MRRELFSHVRVSRSPIRTRARADVVPVGWTGGHPVTSFTKLACDTYLIPHTSYVSDLLPGIALAVSRSRRSQVHTPPFTPRPPHTPSYARMAHHGMAHRRRERVSDVTVPGRKVLLGLGHITDTSVEERAGGGVPSAARWLHRRGSRRTRVGLEQHLSRPTIECKHESLRSLAASLD